MTGTQCSGFSPFEADMVSRECMWICIIRLKLYQSDAACLLWDPPQQTDLKISLLQFWGACCVWMALPVPATPDSGQLARRRLSVSVLICWLLSGMSLLGSVWSREYLLASLLSPGPPPPPPEAWQNLPFSFLQGSAAFRSPIPPLSHFCVVFLLCHSDGAKYSCALPIVVPNLVFGQPSWPQAGKLTADRRAVHRQLLSSFWVRFDGVVCHWRCASYVYLGHVREHFRCHSRALTYLVPDTVFYCVISCPPSNHTYHALLLYRHGLSLLFCHRDMNISLPLLVGLLLSDCSHHLRAIFSFDTSETLQLNRYRVCIADFGFAAAATDGPACLHGLCGSPGW